MTEPTQAHLDEAARLAGYESWREIKTSFHDNHGTRAAVQAHARTLAEFEAHKRAVSDAVKDYFAGVSKPLRLGGFILPDPVEPLAEAMRMAMCDVEGEDYTNSAKCLRDELAKRGLKIVEDKQ